MESSFSFVKKKQDVNDLIIPSYSVVTFYLAAYEDDDGNWLNSTNTFVLHVPKDVPAELFWSLTAYNGKTRAMVYTDVKEIHSRLDIKVNNDGTTDVYLSSQCESTPLPQNCISIKKQGDLFVYFRWYSPTREFFDKTWILPNLKKFPLSD